MTLTLYSIPAPAPDGDALLAEIAAAGLPAPVEVRYLAGQVILPYDAPLSTTQASTLLAVVGAHQNTPALAATRLTARLRALASALLDGPDGPQKLERGILLVLLDEINALRGWLVSFKVATAASTSLADLKTRVAALPDMPDRTAAQARSAVAGKISSGSADA